MHDNKKRRVPMPTQNPEVRNKNFNEVELGYTKEMAMEEASRCLQCRHKPCVSGCPVKIDIPQFIKLIIDGDIESSYNIVYKSNALPGICGRVCPQEKQCEAKCVRGRMGDSVSIGKLERYVSDWYMDNVKADSHPKIKNIKKEKIAIIGSGPSGLTCARELAEMGYSVTVYEALHCIGGVLAYGIPEFRLPRDILESEINALKGLGVQILTNMVIGKILSIDDLFSDGYKAVYVATGAGLPKFMGIPGEGLPGVYSANEFLTRVNLMHAYMKGYDTPIAIPKNAVVVGGGNVAMDAARCVKRLGAEKVTVIYRRSEQEMPARREEINHAKEEKIDFLFLSNPVKICGDDYVNSIDCVKMVLSDPDSSGRRTPVVKDNSTFQITADCVIIAIGNNPNSIVTDSSKDIKCDDKGRIIVNSETLETSKKMTYAGGDSVTGAATVILAMEAGKRAAKQIDIKLKALREESS